MQMPDWLNVALQADQLYAQGRLDDAVAQANLSLRMNPDCAVALQVLGLVDWQTGRAQDGIARLTRAIAIRPDLASAHNALGLCYSQLGDHDRALHEYDVTLV